VTVLRFESFGYERPRTRERVGPARPRGEASFAIATHTHWGTIEVDEDLKRIASRVRSWRDEAGLTLQQLGDRSDVSASTIHKIENLQTVPTIAVLLKVANGLNRRPSELLAEVDVGKQVAVLRRSDRPSLKIQDKGVIEHLVGMIPRNKLDVWRVRLEPGVGAGIAGSEPWQFHGEMVILVEEGRIDAEIGGESFLVGAGDSIHFDPSLPHRWVAGGGEWAQAVVMATIPERLQGDLMERIATANRAAKIRVDGIEALADTRRNS
jgi:transcriptional regulator with XRE-family HTH domain